MPAPLEHATLFTIRLPRIVGEAVWMWIYLPDLELRAGQPTDLGTVGVAQWQQRLRPPPWRDQLPATRGADDADRGGDGDQAGSV